MDDSLVALIVLSLFLGCGCWLVFLWAVQRGQFNDLEAPKHRMLEDDEFISNKGLNRDKGDEGDNCG
jgi:cbb3-type cytochrome oxidase maturation protein